MQNISVLDLLKQGKIYRADYNKIFDKDYLRQYKFLAHQAGFEDCPIFCATEKSKSIISSSGLHKSKSNILLTLNVPDDETYCTEYYTWTDYLYFSTEDTNHSYVRELEDELKQNLIPEHCADPQIIIDRIEPSWVEGLIIDDHKNDDLEDINLIESDQIDDLHRDLMLWLKTKTAITDNPSNGPMYILPNGQFLDVQKIPACYIHQHLFAEFLFSNKVNFDSYNLMRSIEGRFNWLRVNDGRSDDEFRCYISLNHDKLNSDQYFALLKWLDFISRQSDYVQVFVDNDPKSYVKYYFKDYTSDEIIKKIKRYYTSNTLYESDLLEVQSSVKSNQNKSIKRYLQNHYNITLHDGATVHHLVSHKDLIDKDNDYRLKHVVIIDGGDTQTNDAIHRLFDLIQTYEENKKSYNLRKIMNKLGKATVYYLKDNGDLATSNFRELCSNDSIKLRDCKSIDEENDDQIVNESSEDILRLSDDLSDTYIRKYFNNYHKELVSLDDILKDTDNLHNDAMKTRRTEVWGQDPDLYKYDINKGYYGSLCEPIRVAKINGKFIVLDGNHRLRALANNGYKQVEVLVRNV